MEIEGQTGTHDARDDIDRRIRFLDDRTVMEIDFSGLRFLSSAGVNAFYDRVEERIAETGEDLWFFMVNYSDCRIDPAAWVAFSRRGKTVNMAHSMGTVRYDASEETRRQIERDAGTEAFDPNLFSTREAAMARIAQLPSKRRRKVRHAPNYTRADFELRITFHEPDRIMEADFSGFTFHHSRDVDDFYDFIEEAILATGRKWYFLVNLEDCRILPAAWVQYARRGKRLNEGASLGSVRFAPGSETEAEIRLRAESQDFRPNIRNTRDEALARIAELKAEAGQA
ncbi:MAG: hypothetical protein HUJ27_02435 [Rhodobacteraceae bacterium]|nr:hypothetical protein [Paracoccaceae bacterium]